MYVKPVSGIAQELLLHIDVTVDVSHNKSGLELVQILVR